LADIPWFVSPSYAWSTANANVCSCVGVADCTATYTCHFPAADGSGVSLGLDVALGGTTLHADYWFYIGLLGEIDDYEEELDDGGVHSPCLVMSASPSIVFFDTGASNSEWADVGCYYLANDAGTFELTLSGDTVSVTDQGGAAVSSGYTWNTGGDEVGVLEMSQPWNAGGFMTWPIPNVYRQKGDTWISEPFCNTDQSVTLEPNGTVWVEKFDYIESCTTNRQFNGWTRTH